MNGQNSDRPRLAHLDADAQVRNALRDDKNHADETKTPKRAQKVQTWAATQRNLGDCFACHPPCGTALHWMLGFIVRTLPMHV